LSIYIKNKVFYINYKMLKKILIFLSIFHVLIIDHPIDNPSELDDLCNESSNKIITIYL